MKKLAGMALEPIRGLMGRIKRVSFESTPTNLPVFLFRYGFRQPISYSGKGKGER